MAAFPAPSVQRFGEYVNVQGHALFNFINGGANVLVGETHSDRNAANHVAIGGVNIAV